jgi:hypothetical protein
MEAVRPKGGTVVSRRGGVKHPGTTPSSTAREEQPKTARNARIGLVFFRCDLVATEPMILRET